MVAGTSTRHAVALGLAVVAMVSLPAIPLIALAVPALVIVGLVALPALPRPRVLATSPSARMRALDAASVSDRLLWVALGAAIGLVYLVAVLSL